MQVIFNADDFGLTKGVTDGIIQSHTKGIVTSTSLIMNGRAVSHAVEQAKKHPSLRVGLHLVLSWGKPLRMDVDDLMNENGYFKFTNTYNNMPTPNLEQLKSEWQAQIEAFINTELPLNHLDSHHHIHGWDPIKKITVELAKQYNVPVRYIPSLKCHREILRTDYLYTGFYGNGVRKDLFNQLKKVKTDTIEVMTHPAIVDNDLKELSSYSTKRENELDILKSIHVPDWVTLIE